MKVTLISPWYVTFGEFKHADKLGMLYLASYLEKEGTEVEIIDALWEDIARDNLKGRLVKSKPDVVGLTCYTENRFQVFDIVRMVKDFNPRIVTVLGGPHVTDAAEDTLRNLPELDYVVKGEGELTFFELCQRIEEGKDVKSMQGIAFFQENRYFENSPRNLVDDLDSLPFPARHLHEKYKNLDPERMFYYEREFGEYGEKLSSVVIMVSRGCPYNCWFCSNTEFWGNRTRFRSLENVITELELLKMQYGINTINISDDTLNIKKDYINGLCDKMIEKGLGFTWQCNLRANSNVTKDLLLKMKAAGCTGIRMGVESGSPDIQKRVKNIDLDFVREIVGWCDDLRLKRRLNYIVSFPDETLEDARKTIAIIKEFGEPFMVNPLVIFPGTQVEKVGRENGCLPPDFSWSNPRPRLKYSISVPGRSILPLFLDKIPFHKVCELILEAKAIRKRPSRRTRDLFRRGFSVRWLFHLFSRANLIFAITAITFRIRRMWR
jgi:anaerobic magnesium-protoporphyrin IX monomethyl ester cyclase